LLAFEQETYFGSSELSPVQEVARPEPLTPSSLSETTRVETLRGPGSSLSRKAATCDIPSAPGSSDAVVLGNEELGLPGFPRAPLLPTGVTPWYYCSNYSTSIVALECLLQ
jgi:hypothetical protein